MRTALLTHGNGPKSVAAYRSLREHSDLAAVVFSGRRRQRRSLSERFQRYGGWYAGQVAAGRVWTKVRRLRIPHAELRANGIDTESWKTPRDDARVAAWLKEREVEVVFVAGFNFLLKRDFLESFPIVLNIHSSLLPEYRGPRPVLWGLLNGERTFGSTVHHIDEGIDTGDIVAQVSVPRPWVPLEIAVEHRLAQRVPDAVKSVLDHLAKGTLPRTKQNGGSYYPEPTLEHRSRGGVAVRAD